MINLRNYQLKATEELTTKACDFLYKSQNAVISFKAPTGSGKTLMVSEFLKNIANVPDLDISVIWISVRMLHEQSKEKLERYFEDLQLMKCSYFFDISDRKINKNEILFINWESINKKNSNILIRENEQDNNLNSVVKNTIDDGKKILLIIDESHHTANTESSRELIDIISPHLTVEVSATPLNKLYDQHVIVNIADVKEEKMIKNEVSINPEFLSIVIEKGVTSNEIVIDQAINKRKELAQLYKSEGSNINPLILIQLPDNKGGESGLEKDKIIGLLDLKYEININNNKLAVWLSEDKSNNLANIEKNDNEVEVLIFKQAIALGWDCPRASILVIFRETKSFPFTIQTVGRIMRMPQFRYYNNEELNKAYVFTNLDKIILEGDEARDYFTLLESKRDDSRYSEIKLRSQSVIRQRERTRLSGEFVKIFQDVASKMLIDQKLDLSPNTISDFIIAEGSISNIDQLGQIEYGGQIAIPSSSKDISDKFYMFVRKNASPYAMKDSSGRIRTALYLFLENKFGIKRYSENAEKIILGDKNVRFFEEALFKSKEEYQNSVVLKLKSQDKFIDEYKWEIPKLISYNDKYFSNIVKKSIMKPFFNYVNASSPETEFIKLLESSENVEWWYKNRESESKYFSVGYIDEDGFKSCFYVDFIVKFNDGKIGLFDTKKGITVIEKYTKNKAEALQKYIMDENSKGKNLFGGIVVPIDTRHGIIWMINIGHIYSEDMKDTSKWDILRL